MKIPLIGFLSKMLMKAGRALQTKSDPGGFAKYRYTSGQAIGLQDRWDSLAYNGYQNQAIAKHCVDRVANNFAAVPLKLQSEVDGEWQDVPDSDNHPVMELLNKPNVMCDGNDLKIAWASAYLIAGDTFLLGTSLNTAAPPLELWNCRPDRMFVQPSMTGIPLYYELRAAGQSARFSVSQTTGFSQVMHTKRYNPLDDWRGCSPLRSAANQIDQHTWAAEWNKNALQNGGVPSGVFSAGKDDSGNPIMMSDDQRQKLEDDISSKMMGTENARKILIADGGLEFTPMSFSADDLAWLEGSRDAARVIALSIGVPGQLLGIPGDNTYSNFEQAQLAFYEQTILPLARLWIGQLQRWLLPLYGDKLRFIVDEDQISALAPRRAETWTKLVGCSWMTTNEKRIAVGMEPIDDPAADEIMISTMFTPLSQAGAPPEEQSEFDEDGNELPADGDKDESTGDDDGENEDDKPGSDKPGKTGKPTGAKPSSNGNSNGRSNAKPNRVGKKGSRHSQTRIGRRNNVAPVRSFVTAQRKYLDLNTQLSKLLHEMN
jgi:HK97 family phage portal protein